MTEQIGPAISRDNYEFVFDARQQTVALAHFVSGLPDLRASAIALAFGSADLADLADELETHMGDVTWQQLDEPAKENLGVKIVRNWLEDVEWHSLAAFVRHIAYREPLRWVRKGSREFYTAGGLVRVDYCTQVPATPWRLTDERGTFVRRPKPEAETVSLHLTLNKAVKRARRARWHLDHDG